MHAITCIFIRRRQRKIWPQKSGRRRKPRSWSEQRMDRQLKIWKARNGKGIDSLLELPKVTSPTDFSILGQ